MAFGVTPAAAAAIREIAAANEIPAGGGLRITAEHTGDDEVSIDLDFVDGGEDDDVLVEEAGARVFLESEAAELLDEVTLDVEEHGDHVHFRFAEGEP